MKISEGFERIKECVARGPYQNSRLKEKHALQKSREMLAAERTVALVTQDKSGNWKLNLYRAASKQQTNKFCVTLPFYITGKLVLRIVIVH